MKLIDKLTVYKGQYGFSTLLKNNDDKLYVQVAFRKGQEPVQDRVTIDIKDGFLSFYKDKNGLAKPKIVVLEYQEIDSGVSVTTEYSDDLPF